MTTIDDARELVTLSGGRRVRGGGGESLLFLLPHFAPSAQVWWKKTLHSTLSVSGYKQTAISSPRAFSEATRGGFEKLDTVASDSRPFRCRSPSLLPLDLCNYCNFVCCRHASHVVKKNNNHFLDLDFSLIVSGARPWTPICLTCLNLMSVVKLSKRARESMEATRQCGTFSFFFIFLSHSPTGCVEWNGTVSNQEKAGPSGILSRYFLLCLNLDRWNDCDLVDDDHRINSILFIA